MNFIDFLELCKSKSIRFSMEQAQLKVNAPSGTLTPALVETLRRFKPDLVQLLQGYATTSFHPIPVLPRNTDLHASFGQEQMWLSHKLDAVGDGYHFVRILDLHGELDLTALRASFSQVLDRHEALRSVIEERQGDIFQRILPAVPLHLPVTDLTTMPTEQRAGMAARRQQEIARKPFDLTRDLNLRLDLVKLDQSHHQLQLVLHHIASDGWSLGILVKELQALYASLLRNEVPQLAPLPVQYADYSHWLRKDAQQQARQVDRQYWQLELEGVSELHALPTDFPRPVVQSFNGRRLKRQLDAAITQQLKQCAKRHGATLFMVLESLFVLLLARHGQTDDVLLGTTVANRPHDDLAPLIGYFVNMVPLRHHMDTQLSFNEYLPQARQKIISALQHSNVPFENLVQHLVRSRSTSYRPLLQIAFVLQNNDIPALQFPGMDCTILQPESSSVVFDLQLEMTENADGLACCWDYATDLFAPASMERLATHFETLLRGALATPDLPLCQLNMLSQAERGQQLFDFNRNELPYPSSQCLHEWFEHQVVRTPDAIALKHEQQVMTYAQLNTHANRLAHWLVSERAVVPGVLAGICLARSPLMVVAMFGILKAGAAYVPLDPEYPVARLAFMMEDAALGIVLTATGLPDKVGISAQQAVCLDEPQMQAQLQLQPTHNLPVKALGLGTQDLAYVIYTSGSTGLPKGVMLSHSNASAFVAWAVSAFKAQELACVLASTTISFDISVFEIFAPLACGGSALIVENIMQLSTAPCRNEITLINTVPSAAAAILAHMEIAPSVEVFNLAGEPLKQSLVDALYARGIRSVNDLYGPTEDTVYSTMALRQPQGQASIGKSIANSSAYVLDQHRQLLPLGVSGELMLGGAGLARGYLNRPELTEEKFIPNPFFDPQQANSSERLYRTGDLVRWLPDGSLAYMGRIDFQVKIRGFRIELGEIESALRAQTTVQDALVVAADSGNGYQQLVAYVVPTVASGMIEQLAQAQAKRSWINTLESALATSLPDYMVPSCFMVLPSWPLTQNGKLDRKALPQPDVSVLQGNYVAPETPTQRLLCTCWQDLLGLSQVGIEDNFFRLGGHSLLAMKVLTQIRQEWGVEIPVNVIFSNPTVETLATYIDALTLSTHISTEASDEFDEEGTF